MRVPDDDSESDYTASESDYDETASETEDFGFDEGLPDLPVLGGTSTGPVAQPIIVEPSPPPLRTDSDLTGDETQAPRPRRGLGLPGFMKRSSSAKSSVATLSSLQSAESAPSEGPPSRPSSRLRLKTLTRKASSTSLNGTASEPSRTAANPRRRIRTKHRRKRGAKDRDYSFNSSDDILGLCFVEIHSANDLPRWKNMTRLSFDMDPFVVVSFGHKVFRTSVIRHSLNPNWDERLWFQVRRHEANHDVIFSIYDWDKVSSNDFVGDASIPLSQLLQLAPKPDFETQLFKSVGGTIEGDQLHEFLLPINASKSSEMVDQQGARIKVRVKFTPYAALRQQFWRKYLQQYGRQWQ